ncbi:MAG: Bax inhibitor-1/YccA family protein [bacterium]
MRISNPVFSSLSQESTGENQATMRGVAKKTGILLAITFIVAITFMVLGVYDYWMLIASSIIGMIAVIMGRTNPKAAPIAGVVYAACEGVLLGTISGLFASIEGFEGAVPIAVLATLAVFITMVLLYSTKIVAATPTLMKVMYSAGMAIIMFMLLSFVLSLFGFNSIMNMFTTNITFTAILMLLFIGYGAFMLVLNFNEAQQYVEAGFDESYEWIAALGLIVTIVFIYIQILRFVVLILGNRRN